MFSSEAHEQQNLEQSEEEDDMYTAPPDSHIADSPEENP